MFEQLELIPSDSREGWFFDVWVITTHKDFQKVKHFLGTFPDNEEGRAGAIRAYEQAPAINPPGEGWKAPLQQRRKAKDGA